MALHEIVKNVKIIDEMMIYLIDKGNNEIDMSFSIEEDQTVIIFTIVDPTPEILDCLNTDIYAERDLELEEYAWELMGEDDYSCELQQLGMMIDSMELVEFENRLRIILTRKNK